MSAVHVFQREAQRFLVHRQFVVQRKPGKLAELQTQPLVLRRYLPTDRSFFLNRAEKAY